MMTCIFLKPMLLDDTIERYNSENAGLDKTAVSTSKTAVYQKNRGTNDFSVRVSVLISDLTIIFGTKLFILVRNYIARIIFRTEYRTLFFEAIFGFKL